MSRGRALIGVSLTLLASAAMSLLLVVVVTRFGGLGVLGTLTAAFIGFLYLAFRTGRHWK